jgi:Family of unknown function (DUF6134)
MKCRRLAALAALSIMSFAATTATPAGPAHDAMAPNVLSPDVLYGGPIEFEILRNGTPVGSHRVGFMRDGDLLYVSVSSEIVVRLLSIPVYRFHYQSQSRWQDGRLLSITSATDDDGKTSTVEARVAGDKADIDGPAGKLTAALPLYATDHWNPDELRQSVMLNNITGKLDHIEVVADGASEIETDAGPRAANRYEFKGDINFTAWYDPAGRWVGLHFKGKDGSSIDYRCHRCGPER